jgi:CHAD domain-containing protein
MEGPAPPPVTNREQSVMAFQLEQGPVPKAIRKVVQKQLDKALGRLEGHERSLSDAGVHDARKRFKEIRSTLRLVRAELGEKAFQRENQALRDAGRPLSTLRDAKVLVDSLDHLVEHFNGRIHLKSVATLRRQLLERRRAARKQVILRDHAISRVVRDVRAVRNRVDRWPLQHRGWKALEDGLLTVYAGGREATRQITDRSSDDELHEWRKRAQYLRYELELLEPIWSDIVTPLADQTHHLTDLLGDDHDLVVLRGIAVENGENGKTKENELVLTLIDERRAKLQEEARMLGAKLYAETPREFAERLHGYWKSARAASS